MMKRNSKKASYLLLKDPTFKERVEELKSISHISPFEYFLKNKNKTFLHWRFLNKTMTNMRKLRKVTLLVFLLLSNILTSLLVFLFNPTLYQNGIVDDLSYIIKSLLVNLIFNNIVGSFICSTMSVKDKKIRR